jgi:hypothetical protein
MRRKDDCLTGTDEITSRANDLGVCGCDLTDSVTIVWVAEDDGAADEGRVCRAEHGCCVVDELTTLTADSSTSDTEWFQEKKKKKTYE